MRPPRIPVQSHTRKPMSSIARSLLPALLISCLACGPVQAAVQLSSTRVIMNEKDRNAIVTAKNNGTQPVVVQAWVDGAAEEMKTPFFMTPPLSRFDGGEERNLTVSRVDDDFPADRESYYWVNVLEIPQKVDSQENSLALAIRTRIKLFYRPAAILKAARGPDQVSWQLERNGGACSISITNASPYTINFSRIDIDGDSDALGKGMVALPLEQTRVVLPKCPARSSIQVQPRVVNDYGAVDAWPALTLQEGRSVMGSAK